MLTQTEKIEAVARMQDHIEAHLGEKITLLELARVARYSQWHAARLFKEITGKTPFEYVRLRRLSAAAERLRETSCKVVDVAFDFVFDSHAGFTRAFARQFGISPDRFRKSGSKVELFAPHRIQGAGKKEQPGEHKMETKLQTVFVQVLDRPERQMIIKRGKQATDYYEYCNEVGCDVWEKLTSIENALQEPMGLWMPANLRPEGTSEYAMGVEVPTNYSGRIPEGFEIVSLPACKMMVFQGPPYDDKDFENSIACLCEIIESYKPEIYGFKWANEDGPRFQLQPEGYRGYIEGRPIRQL